MTTLLSIYVVIIGIWMALTEWYDFAWHKYSKRYSLRFCFVGFSCLSVGWDRQDYPIMYVGCFFTFLGIILMSLISYLDYQREGRNSFWFDREGL